MPLTTVDLLTAAAILAAGSLLQGSIGFGLALVAAPFLILIDPMLVPGPLLVGCFVLTVLIAWRERESIEIAGLSWALVGRVLGTAAGASFISLMPGNIVSIAFGALVLLGVGVSAMGVRVAPNGRNMFGAGTLSGFMGTTTAIGGPPMALILQDEKGSKLRGMLSAFFIFGTVVSMASLATVGRFGAPEFKTGLLLLPGIMLGFAMSARCRKYIDRGLVRPAVLMVSAAAAVIVIVQAVGG